MQKAGAGALAAAWDEANPGRGTEWPYEQSGGRGSRHVRSIKAGGFTSASVCGTGGLRAFARPGGWDRLWPNGPGLGNGCPAGGLNRIS